MCLFLLTDLVSTTADIDRLTGFDEELQKRSAALLVLKLKEQRRVSQVAIDDIVEHSKAQFERTLTILLAEVRSHLAERGVCPSDLCLDSALSKFNHPFSELDTKYKQEQYFKDKLGNIFMPMLSIIPLNSHFQLNYLIGMYIMLMSCLMVLDTSL